jgi:HAD superfamily hydrolase (TIGR01549 family)
VLLHPQAILLDFGGVIVSAPARPPVPVGLVDRLYELTAGMLPASRIEHDLTAGARAYARWRDDVSSLDRPAELTHEQVWSEFVTERWPADLSDAVRREATALSYAWAFDDAWAVRPGIRELLEATASANLPAAVVSNTLCGRAHRDFLDRVGLADRFAAQFYSDEAGVRKPNPELAWRAARAIDVAIGGCWFVGDSPVRDIACARRAGVGAAILMRSPRTERDGRTTDLIPDATVEDGYGVLELLRKSQR